MSEGYQEWRNEIFGGTLRADELTFCDVAALLEDIASGGYPYQLGEDRRSVRVAIVARAAQLLRHSQELLDAARNAALECQTVGCDGTGFVHRADGVEYTCSACKPIRAATAKAEGRS